MAILIIIFALLALIALAFGVAYIVFIIWTIRKKRFKLLTMLLLAPILIFGSFIWGINTIIQYEFKRNLEGLFSIPTELDPALFRYDSPRDFKGDGYSFSVYTLPKSIAERFTKADKKFLETFPIRPEHRKRWKTVFWHKTPFNSDYKMYLDFALSSYDKDNCSDLKEHFEKIRIALNSPGNYYSFFYYNHGDYPGNIDFFLIDLTNMKLYIINHNT